MIFDRDDITLIVVVNHKEQYSIWPEYKEIAAGWRAVGKSGTRQECLAHIKTVWTDMPHLNLRKHMEEHARAGQARPPAVGPLLPAPPVPCIDVTLESGTAAQTAIAKDVKRMNVLPVRFERYSYGKNKRRSGEFTSKICLQAKC